jgi:hypothetical protein
MNKTKIVWSVVIIVLLFSTVFLALRCVRVQEELKQARTVLEIQKVNTKALLFTKMLIEEVLKSETEVNFETRLQLENSVRRLGDENILRQWNIFVNSDDSVVAQREMKNLLSDLINKINIIE